MARLRGDDDLLSLMGEMATQQGYDAISESARSANASSLPETRVRLTPEITGYPSSQLAGGTMIWNPYVQVSSPPTPTKCAFPSTNPQVEVFRRRAFERFKSDFRATLDRISANATANVGLNNLWKELSPVSMLERWHFDAKLQEFLHTVHESRALSCSGSTAASTPQIKLAMEGGYVDPILILSHVNGRQKRKEGGGQTAPSFQSAGSLLADEVKFEWTRAWKRIAGDKYKDSDLQTVFESKKFRRKLSNLTRSVMESAAQVEASFFDQVSKRAALEAQQQPGRHSKKHSIPKIVSDDEDGAVYVKFSGLSFKLNVEHYRKLQVMFDRQNTIRTDRTTHEADFASCLFCLLCRYDMLQGAGLQSSMHGSVFDVLLQHFDCRLECFASPLNSRYERYCSAFFDTDGAFGSVATFFDHDFSRGGCYQANPPFATNFIESMYETMEMALQTCNEVPLMFVVFVPAWKETAGWILLNESPYLTRSISLLQSSHYYCEGTQHRRRDRYRVASFDTSVFFLQNEAARTKWSITKSQIEDLKIAFSVDPSKGGEHVALERTKEDEPSATGSTIVKTGSTSVSATEQKEAHHNKKKTKKKNKRNKKQKMLPEGEEGSKQLDILSSLDLPAKAEPEGFSIAKPKKKRRRK